MKTLDNLRNVTRTHYENGRNNLRFAAYLGLLMLTACNKVPNTEEKHDPTGQNIESKVNYAENQPEIDYVKAYPSYPILMIGPWGDPSQMWTGHVKRSSSGEKEGVVLRTDIPMRAFRQKSGYVIDGWISIDPRSDKSAMDLVKGLRPNYLVICPSKDKNGQEFTRFEASAPEIALKLENNDVSVYRKSIQKP